MAGMRIGESINIRIVGSERLLERNRSGLFKEALLLQFLVDLTSLVRIDEDDGRSLAVIQLFFILIGTPKIADSDITLSGNASKLTASAALAGNEIPGERLLELAVLE